MVLATPQQALDATHTDPRLTVYVNDVLTGVISYSGQHGTGQEIATASLQVPLPHPDHIVPLAPVEVQGGHNDLVGTIFSGYIPAWEGDLASRGALLDITVVGWAALLAEQYEDDIVYAGPVPARAVFVDLCGRAGVPAYIADHCTYPDGITEVMLGGNPQHEDGTVTIKARQSPLSQLNRLLDPYGYRVFDTPNGTVVLRRVNGMPPTAPVVTFAEGVNLISVGRGYDTRGIVNAWDVQGITYEDEFGGRVPVRSRSAGIVPDPGIPIDGIRHQVYSNSDIVRQDQADAVRNNLEIRHSAPDTPIKWQAVALPMIAPGDVVAVESPYTGAGGLYWLRKMDLRFDRRGFVGSYEGWAGAGVALPALNEQVRIPIQTAPLHLGDEHVPWYAQPSPQGTSKQWTFTLPEKVTVANVRGWSHSWNAQRIGGVETSLDVSRWEIWEAGVDQNDRENRPISQGSMPKQTEDYHLRHPYSRFETVLNDLGETVVTDPGHWLPFAINLRTLDPGDYVLKFICGTSAGYDDGEIRLVTLQLFGINSPVIVTGGA